TPLLRSEHATPARLDHVYARAAPPRKGSVWRRRARLTREGSRQTPGAAAQARRAAVLCLVTQRASPISRNDRWQRVAIPSNSQRRQEMTDGAVGDAEKEPQPAG